MCSGVGNEGAKAQETSIGGGRYRRRQAYALCVGLLVALILVVLAVVEIFVIVQVVHAIGVLLTVALLIVVSAVGVRICAHSGLAAMRRFRSQMAERRMPGMALLDGLWILVAGALLVVPGFVTDGLALLLLLPRFAGGRPAWPAWRWRAGSGPSSGPDHGEHHRFVIRPSRH